MVGGKNRPRSGSGHGLVHVGALARRPPSTKPWILSSWAAELIAPTSVFLSSGSPTRSVVIRRAQPVQQLVGDRLLHQQPRARAAHVALVEEDPLDDALDGLVQRRVVEDDVGRLAAQLQREPLAGARERALDRLADLGGAGERHLVHAGVGHQRRRRRRRRRSAR